MSQVTTLRRRRRVSCLPWGSIRLPGARVRVTAGKNRHRFRSAHLAYARAWLHFAPGEVREEKQPQQRKSDRVGRERGVRRRGGSDNRRGGGSLPGAGCQSGGGL